MTPTESRKQPNWTPAERAHVASLVGRVSPDLLPALTGRTIAAIRRQLNRHGVTLRDVGEFRNTLTVTRTAQMLGVASTTTVYRWVRRGLLKANHRPTILRQRVWFVHWGELVEFVRDHADLLAASPPPRFLPDGSPNPVHPYWVPPPPDGYLCSKQVARAVGLSHWTVLYHLRQGRFPGAFKPKRSTRDAPRNAWLIPPAAVPAFLARPSRQPRVTFPAVKRSRGDIIVRRGK